MTAGAHTSGAFALFISPQQIRVDHVRFTCFGRALLLDTTRTSQKPHSVSVTKTTHKL